MNTLSCTRGNDFEFHLFDTEKEKMVSAIPILKCDKHSPIDLGDGIKVYADNVLLETAFPPYNTKEEMEHRFHTVFSRIQNQVLGKRLHLMPVASFHYADEELSDPKASEIGCTPNFNAWTVSMNEMNGFPNSMRTAGAHFHLGNPKLTDFDTLIKSVRLLDMFLGIPSVIFNSDETEISRRQIYGRASENRPTPFGLEYRPLSPGVLRSKESCHLIYDLIDFALSFVADNKMDVILGKADPKLIQAIINKCDAVNAQEFVKSSVLPDSLKERIFKLKQSNSAKKDFYKSWKLAIK